MNDQLDRAVRSVLTDIISTAPAREAEPLRTLDLIESPSRSRRPYLAAAAAVLAVAGIGGLALAAQRDSGSAPASAPNPSLAAATSLPLESSVVTTAPPEPDVTTTTSEVPVPEGPMADLYAQVAYRVNSGATSLTALGLPNNEYSIDNNGVTTVWATDPDRPDERKLTIVMTPGSPVMPEDHSRTPVVLVALSTETIRVENHSNNGWSFSVEFVDSDGGPLPTVEQLEDLIYALDP